jgi:CHAD domain-containing protein
MKLQPGKVEKPLSRLRKQLKEFPANPGPEDVHSLRTRARRLEATMTALALHRDKSSRRLLKLITPVRKAAGKVRDMDVLIGDTLTLSEDRGSSAVVSLIEHLAKMRMRHERKLCHTVKNRSRDIRKGLKVEANRIRKKLKKASPDLDDTTGPRILITELSHWPALEENNLHLFRIRIKELRYILQLETVADGKLISTLGEAKDAIGAWHDWVELVKIAMKTLDRQAEGPLLAKMEQIRSQKLQVALAAANQLRTRYFAVPDGRKASRKILPMAS